MGLAMTVMAVGSGSALVAVGRPQQAAALANRGAIAEALLRRHPSPADSVAIARIGIAAVPALPIAWHALAVDAHARGAQAEASGYLAIADRWTRRDTDTQAMAYRYAVARGDAPAAMRHADSLLRRGRLRAALFADIAARLGNPAMVSAFAALLTTRPGWRLIYFSTAATTTSGAAIDALLARLRAIGSPLGRTEAQQLLAGLIARGEVARASAIWQHDLTQTAPAGSLLWPDAAARATPTPFDWRLSREIEPFVSIEGNRLNIEGRIDDNRMDVATRVLVLNPGVYRITTNAALPADGWRWTIACDGRPIAGSRPIAEGEMTVPVGCRHVLLGLSVAGNGTASVEYLHIAPLHRT